VIFYKRYKAFIKNNIEKPSLLKDTLETSRLFLLFCYSRYNFELILNKINSKSLPLTDLYFFCSFFASPKKRTKKGAFYEAFFNTANALLKTMPKTARLSFGRTWISQLLNIYAA